MASDDPEGSIAQLERALAEEQRRLEKLWDAYEKQEGDLNDALDRINRLEAEIQVKETMNKSLEDLLGERDAKLRGLEIARQHQAKVAAEYEPQLAELKAAVKDQTTKYDRLLSITRDMEDELNLAKEALRSRDGWFDHYVGRLEEISTLVKQWRQIQAGNFPEFEETKPEEAEVFPDRAAKAEFIATLTKIKGLGPAKAERIFEAGITSIEALKKADVSEIADISGFTKMNAEKVVKGAKDL